ncbi:hypothetical protein [Mycobacterium riyadhense]|uniref:Uncharacterized protein n=1 Tax=Mycobacterium riyadhense TaxID=486698 RepID=A0A1X2DEB3_9MYCO|nr:hypothetical protein [Mycobacterium riyadhense]MCV7146916.1 hypothetical protein [Mycobacterium riyadhense]ORW86456.1 hypothetical protein AWC22_10900 [Mycobacterium riyadhense]
MAVKTRVGNIAVSKPSLTENVPVTTRAILCLGMNTLLSQPVRLAVCALEVAGMFAEAALATDSTVQ